MAHKRKCMICGKEYEYCGQGCADYNADEPWRYLFHNEQCRDIYDVWQSYRGKQMQKSEAANILGAIDLKEVLNSGSVVVNDIKEILDIKEEKKINVEKKEVETKSEDIPQKKNDFKKK